MVHNTGVRPRPSEHASVSEDVLAARFEQQVAMATDRMAILTDRGEVTYRELDSMANGIAAMLCSSTVDPERPIALLLQDMILCVAAMLGAAKAGRIYIPLDIGFPETWLAQTLNTGEAALVFTDENTAPIVSRVAGEQSRRSANNSSQEDRWQKPVRWRRPPAATRKQPPSYSSPPARRDNPKASSTVTNFWSTKPIHGRMGFRLVRKTGCRWCTPAPLPPASSARSWRFWAARLSVPSTFGRAACRSSRPGSPTSVSASSA
jgi:acyl-CoA synthetase (AMP-forming)/AMP-acid ligase II